MVSLEKDKSVNCSYSVLISTIKTCWIFECARTSLPQSGGGGGGGWGGGGGGRGGRGLRFTGKML